MINIPSDEKELEIMGAKLAFLKCFPLEEIDNDQIRLICISYRNNNSTLLSCLTFMRRHDEYFHNWWMNNKACNLFYGPRRR